MLLYLNAAIWVLYLLAFGPSALAILAVAAVLAGLGVANEKKAGYRGALAVAVLNLLFLLLAFWGGVRTLSVIINMMFGAALLALLLHPMSRSYQRIWFKRMGRTRR